MENRLQAIIMAAGRSSRFKTNRSKLTEAICGQEMILYPTKMLEKLNISTSVIVGYRKAEVEQIITKQHKNRIKFVEQAEQKGTAHALMCSEPVWDKEHILILNADVPLISSDLITKLWTQHLSTGASVSFVAAHNIDPALDSYGRVVIEDNLIKIIEAKDYKAQAKTTSASTNEPCCINAGIYIFSKKFLTKAISEIQTSSVTGEFYITDLISIASQKGLTVEIVDAPIDQVRGINTLRELWIAEQIKQAEIINHWMSNGVRFQMAQTNHVELNVTIGAGTYIGQGVQLTGNTDIDQDCKIEPFTLIDNSTIGPKVTIKPFSIIKDSVIHSGSSVGPFVNFSANTIIESGSNIGNFTEIKASQIGQDTEIRGLNYLGSSQVGQDVLIGAGTVVCDHNGHRSARTTIEDQAYIGANNSLISPVIIGAQALTGAGSVITEDVPQGALSIARATQVNKPSLKTRIKPAIKHDQSNLLT
jgi:bifunctional UDP-N-acetylglucosamine pyrophosphorylase/glucosamine-1-phosphate N-acetyltransferase